MKKTIAIILLILSVLFAVGCDSGGQENQVSSEEKTTGFDETVVDVTDGMYSYTDLQEDLEKLSQKYPDLFAYGVIGTTHEGRSIYSATLGNSNSSKKLVITASTHGREFLTSTVLMAHAERILREYETGGYEDLTYKQLFNDCSLILVPMLNPDGVMLAEEGISSLTTQEAIDIVTEIYNDWNDSPDVTIDRFISESWKANAVGVDLNRNSPIDGWKSLSTGVSAPCFKNYKGTEQEAETVAMMNLINGDPAIVGLIAFHTSGHIVYWDCIGCSIGTKMKNVDLANITRDVTEASGNKYAIGYTPYLDGSIPDWCALVKNIPAVTVEMGNAIYPTPASEISPAVTETENLIPAYAKYFISN